MNLLKREFIEQHSGNSWPTTEILLSTINHKQNKGSSKIESRIYNAVSRLFQYSCRLSQYATKSVNTRASTDSISKGGVSPGFTLYQELRCTFLNVDSLHMFSILNRGVETSDPTDPSIFNLPVRSKEKEWLWDVGPGRLSKEGRTGMKSGIYTTPY